MKRLTKAAAAVLLALFAACDERLPPGESADVAAELRLLRQALQQANKPAPPTPAAPFDAKAFAEAMAPLRDALTALASDQNDLRSRQAMLTQELQRWTALLAQSVSGQAKAESEALLQRLQQVEAALQQQDARHREVEDLLRGALDRTADRLEQFLQRLQALPGTTGGGASREGDAGAGAAEAPGKAGNGEAPPAADNKPAGAASGEPPRGALLDPRGARATLPPWLLAVLATGTAAALTFVWLWHRSPAAPPVPHDIGTADATEDPGLLALVTAAATLHQPVLGEVAPENDPPPASAGAGVGGIEDVFVLDPDEASDASANPTAAAPAPDTPAAAATSNGPPWRSFAAPGSPADPGPQRVLQLLRADPRVLRRPEPRQRHDGSGVVFEFAVLPDLSERALRQLDDHLRDALRG